MFLVVYVVLVALLASRIPLDGEKAASWVPWSLGLVLAALGVGLVSMVSGFMESMSDMRMVMADIRMLATGRIEDVRHIDDARTRQWVLTLYSIALVAAPHVLSLAFRASGTTWAGLVPSPGRRHWLLFAGTLAVLTIMHAAARIWLKES
ncbi:hypothetical protein [Zhengella mangrovi]|uniref:hypothetical protein n=1 Tax=Zhengella mangrovi TaxID=1982044 RepID=UPI0013FD2599|nr:hypothetical protein [Zhengella mangrovi]